MLKCLVSSSQLPCSAAELCFSIIYLLCNPLYFILWIYVLNFYCIPLPFIPLIPPFPPHSVHLKTSFIGVHSLYHTVKMIYAIIKVRKPLTKGGAEKEK